MNGNCNHLALKFSVCVKERQDWFPTMYWLPKRHKRPYKSRFIANSSSCTTTEFSKLLTSCLTAVKNRVIRYCEKVYERSGKTLFWSIINYGEVLNKLKSRGFRATSLTTYDFPHSIPLCPNSKKCSNISEKSKISMEFERSQCIRDDIHNKRRKTFFSLTWNHKYVTSEGVSSNDNIENWR